MSARLTPAAGAAVRQGRPLACRLVVLGVAFVVFLGVGGCSAKAKPDARVELAAAISLTRSHDLYAGNVDWSTAVPQAYAELGSRTAPSAADLPISELLSQLHDKHARLIPVGAAAGPSLDPAAPLPSATISGDVAILTMPGWSGTPGQGQRYVRAAWQAFDQDQPACGWVVDLTDNGGGDLWPMLAGAEPLLTLPKPVGAQIPGQPIQMFDVTGGTVTEDGHRQAYGAPPARVSAPIAVLTGRFTTSSGEWLVLALKSNPAVRTFGEPTAGAPTSPDLFQLPGGAQLELAVSASVDTHGSQHTTPLVPDAVTTTPLADAQRWLTAQCSPR